MPPLGEAFVYVQHSGWQRFPPLLVVEGDKSALFGRLLAHGCEPRLENLPDLNPPSSISSVACVAGGIV